MFDFKKLKDKKNLIGFIVSAVVAVLILVAFISMATHRTYFRMTIGADFVIRYLLLYVCAAGYLASVISIGLLSVTNLSPEKTLSRSFLFCLITEVVIIPVTVLGLIGNAEYQNSMELMEDVLYVFVHLIIAVLCFFGYAFKGNRKKTFIVAIIACSCALLCSIVDLAFIGPNTTIRTYDFMFVISTLSTCLPYATIITASRLFLTDSPADNDDPEISTQS